MVDSHVKSICAGVWAIVFAIQLCAMSPMPLFAQDGEGSVSTGSTPRPKIRSEGQVSIEHGGYDPRVFVAEGNTIDQSEIYLFHEPLVFVVTKNSGELLHNIDDAGRLTLFLRWDLFRDSIEDGIRHHFAKKGKPSASWFIGPLDARRIWLESTKKATKSVPRETNFTATERIPIHFELGSRDAAEEFLAAHQGENPMDQFTFKYTFEGVSEENCWAEASFDDIQNIDRFRNLFGEGGAGLAQRHQAVRIAQDIVNGMNVTSRCSDATLLAQMAREVADQLGRPESRPIAELGEYATLDNDLKAGVTKSLDEASKSVERTQDQQALSTAASDAASFGVGGLVGDFAASISGGLSEANSSARQTFSDVLKKHGISGQWKGERYAPSTLDVYTREAMLSHWGSGVRIEYVLTKDATAEHPIILTKGSWRYSADPVPTPNPIPGRNEIWELIVAESEEIQRRHDTSRRDIASLIATAVGTVVAWYPTPDDLDANGNLIPPPGWLVCDGANGTPNLRNRFIYGAATVEEAGDSIDGDPTSHVHAVAFDRTRYNEWIDYSRGGSHQWTSAGEHDHKLRPLDKVSHLPPIVRMVYIIKARGAGAVLDAASADARAAGKTSQTMDDILMDQRMIDGSLNSMDLGLGRLTPPRVITPWYPNADAVDANGNVAPPPGWSICDGTRGTPDLRNRFIYGTATLGEVGTKGGAPTHGHSGTTHSSGAPQRGDPDSEKFPAGDHSHKVTLEPTEHLPPSVRMVYIMSTRRRAPGNVQLLEDPVSLLTIMQRNQERLGRLAAATAAWLPARSIAAWHPASGERRNLEPPPGWVLCDGQNGTPDLRDRFIYGTASMKEVATLVGSVRHTHKGSMNSAGGPGVESDHDLFAARGDHRHGVRVSEAPHLPARVKLLWIMKTR